MKKFMDESFMLNSDTAVRLYDKFAKDMPICDYHCHLSPKEMYKDKQFDDITQIFLGGDHYKWRYIRSCGVDEEYITGGKSSIEKFRAFCECLQYAIGNPLYHWTHLELKRYFNIDDIVTAKNSDDIYKRANEYIEKVNMTPSYLINSSNVKYICTTDDPADSLEYHIKIREKGHINAKVLPTFRPDNAVGIEKETFASYVSHLSEVTGMEIQTYSQLIDALYARIEFFHEQGCRISDHSLGYIPYRDGSEKKAFKKAMAGLELSEKEIDSYKTALMRDLAAKYSALNWAMQLHIGALRNNNTRMFNRWGADAGFDSMADYEVAENLSKLLNSMEQNEALPKTILYTLNPKDNYVLGTMIGNFQSNEAKSKMQFGSAWWFNDQRDGMENQLKALANLGSLPNFVGMLTDSRSFLSYTRHEYFRRILCNLIGTWVENGEFPDDEDTLETIIKGICFNNAEKFFKF